MCTVKAVIYFHYLLIVSVALLGQVVGAPAAAMVDALKNEYLDAHPWYRTE